MDQIQDRELLRQTARLLENEVLRLGDKLVQARKRIAELEGRTPEEIQTHLKLLEDELNASIRRSPGGSERRPRLKEAHEPKKRERSGPTPQPSLPVHEVVHDLDVADKACPACGAAMKPFKGQDEVTEIVSVRAVKYFIEKHVRKKYRCTCGGAVETAPVPPRLVPGGRYSDELIVHTAKQKYDAHVPLARLARLARQEGLKVTTQTLFKNLKALSDVFEEPLERLHDYLLSKEVLLADETRWPLLGAKGRKTSNYTTWALMGGDAVRYFILDSRGNASGSQVLRNYQGILVTDGYGVYKSLSKQGNYRHAFCWAHLRRYFLAAEETEPVLAGEFIEDIGNLFLMEREIKKRSSKLSEIEARKLTTRVRQQRSVPLVNRLGERAMRVRALPKSKMATAIRYLSNHWEGLTLFLKEPAVPMTTNRVEFELRAIGLGRNNHLGSRSEVGARVSANLYSLVESAKLNGLASDRYLLEALRHHHRGEPLPLPHELEAQNTN